MSALLLTLLRHRTLALGGAAALALAAAAGWTVHRLDRAPLERAQAQVAAAQVQARAASAQAELDAAAATAVEGARTAESHATARSGAAADALARLPHASDPLDADVLRDWSAAVDGLRDDAARAHPAADAARGAGAARSLPPA